MTAVGIGRILRPAHYADSALAAGAGTSARRLDHESSPSRGFQKQCAGTDLNGSTLGLEDDFAKGFFHLAAFCLYLYDNRPLKHGHSL